MGYCQLAEQGGGTREVWDEIFYEIPFCIDIEGLDSTEVWNDQQEHILKVVCAPVAIEEDFQR